MPPKRILNIGLSYNCPRVLNFFLHILENENVFQILGSTGSCIEGA